MKTFKFESRAEFKAYVKEHGYVFDGNLDFGGCEWLTGRELPDGLEANTIWFAGCESLCVLPKNIKADKLTLVRCNKIIRLPKCMMVCSLAVKDCSGIISIPNISKCDFAFVRRCSSIKEVKISPNCQLEIEDLPNLKKITTPLSLKVFVVRDCDSLSEITSKIVASLIDIESNKALKELPNGVECANVEIFDCPKLQALPDIEADMLDIEGCEALPFSQFLKHPILENHGFGVWYNPKRGYMISVGGSGFTEDDYIKECKNINGEQTAAAYLEAGILAISKFKQWREERKKTFH